MLLTMMPYKHPVRESDLFHRNDVQMANERLLQLLSDVVQSNIQTENRISHRLTTLVSQSAGRSPRSETGGDDGAHARDTVDGKGSGHDAATGGIAAISPRFVYQDAHMMLAFKILTRHLTVYRALCVLLERICNSGFVNI